MAVFWATYIAVILILYALDGGLAAATCMLSKIPGLAWLAETTVCPSTVPPGTKSTAATCMLLIAVAWFVFFVGPLALFPGAMDCVESLIHWRAL